MKLIPFTTFRTSRPVVARHPWSALDADLESLFAPILAGAPVYRPAPSSSVEETDTQFVVRFEVPGVKRDALTLDWQDDTLTLAIKREEKSGQETVTREQRHSFSLPEGVEVQKASATLEDGVLTLTLPKQAPVQPHRIEIK